jgi:hypothetical protein
VQAIYLDPWLFLVLVAFGVYGAERLFIDAIRLLARWSRPVKVGEQAARKTTDKREEQDDHRDQVGIVDQEAAKEVELGLAGSGDLAAEEHAEQPGESGAGHRPNKTQK